MLEASHEGEGGAETGFWTEKKTNPDVLEFASFSAAFYKHNMRVLVFLRTDRWSHSEELDFSCLFLVCECCAVRTSKKVNMLDVAAGKAVSGDVAWSI